MGNFESPSVKWNKGSVTLNEVHYAWINAHRVMRADWRRILRSGAGNNMRVSPHVAVQGPVVARRRPEKRANDKRMSRFLYGGWIPKMSKAPERLIFIFSSSEHI